MVTRHTARDPQGARRARLQQLLEEQNTRPATFLSLSREPAVFRDTLMHTHETLPPGDYMDKGAAVLETKRLTGALPIRRVPKSVPRTVEVVALRPKVPSYRPHFARLQKEHHYAKTHSEWALLDTLDVHMANNEYDHKNVVKQEGMAATARTLDIQMGQLAEREREEAAAKVRERRVVLEATAQYKRDEAMKAKIARERAAKISTEMTSQMLAARAEKERKMKRKLQQEEEELRLIKVAEAKSRAELQRKKEREQVEMMKTVADNDARIAFKRDQKARQAEEDRMLMEETLRAGERAELERERKLQEFHDNIAARASKAGQMAVTAKADRDEREVAQMIRAQEEAEAKAVADRAQRLKKKKELNAEVEAALANQLRIKQKIREEEKEELREYIRGVKVKDYEVACEEQNKLDRARERNVRTHDFLELQIEEKEQRDVLAGIYMTDAERALNKPALIQADRHVGAPRILPLKTM